MEHRGEYEPLGFEKSIPKGYVVVETRFKKGRPLYTVLRDKTDKYYLYKVNETDGDYKISKVKASEKSNFKEMENTYE